MSCFCYWPCVVGESTSHQAIGGELAGDVSILDTLDGKSVTEVIRDCEFSGFGQYFATLK